ncbi:hypothetical protein IKD60_01280 [Candidatus Saccharibacteria bacterium]|nr:hypothetical protein [Candidatus Saccharibacteria bacterium]
MSKPKHLSIKQITKHQSYYRMFIAGCGAFLIAFIASATLAPVKNSDASTVTITNSLTGYYLTITSADTVPISVEASPMGQLAAAKDTINVKTNSPNGYKLYLSTSTTDNNIYKSGSAANASMGYFSATSGTLESPSKLTQNTWGFSLTAQNTTTPEDTATWAAVPVLADASTNQIDEVNTNNVPDGKNLDIYYGVNASTTLPEGDYTTEITYTAFSEGVNSFPTMQSFTAADCNNLQYDQAINLTDERDGKYYRVTRMKDNNCWMTQNLALNGTDNTGEARLLTPQDSNVSTNRYLAENIVDGTTSVNDAIQIYSGSTNGVVDDSFATTEQTATDGTKMPYGNLYNFMAATAGVGTATSTGEITESICPKGWRLPGNTGDYSYSNLFGKYDLPTANTTNATAVAKVQQSPFYMPLAGSFFENTPPTSTNALLHYWSRTIANTTTAYALRVQSSPSYFFPNDNYNKKVGNSVRCVFVNPKLADITTMQAMTTDICNATLIGQTASLTDTRGGGSGGGTSQSYGVLKAADGNCWMTDNLNLYNKTISSSDSDFPSGTYTIPAGITDPTEWNTNNYQTKKVEVAHGLGNNADKNNTYGTWGEVYYNWTVAVAKEDTTSYTTTGPDTSICPKGWTLPTNGDKGVNKSWAKLLDTYSITTSEQLRSNSTLGFTKYYGFWDLDDASENAQGSGGYFWSGTPSAETNAYYMRYNSGGVYPQNNVGKGYGDNIRCVAR